ncbi:hypothetical protein D9613_008788 [Agrocybe pediades]|uniref:Uncharacterized protein n=1 Tax=Agrocybe pediades TaxID=84607 RepID=A0A8H4VQE5_9AGAR|nr:hypothetical protein D9613_008788 [Agrocybe pediades]
MFDETRWLLFDEEEPELFGRVLVVVEPDSPSFYPTKKVYLSYPMYPFEIITFPDWIAYVKHRWDRDVNREFVKRMVAGPIKIPRPVLYYCEYNPACQETTALAKHHKSGSVPVHFKVQPTEP